MRRSRRGLASRPFLLFVLLSLALLMLINNGVAQDLPDLTESPDDDSPAPTEGPTDADPSPTEEEEEENTPAPTEKPTEEPTEEESESPSESPSVAPTDEDAEEPTLPSVTDEPEESETSDPTETEDDEIDMPDITLPPIPGAKIPEPAVPPKEGAPYLQQSSYPEGTVFIAVGAVLGFFALAVMVWRGLVAWSINRSVRRANNLAQADTAAVRKSRRKSRKSGMYHQTLGTSVSMEKLGSSVRHSALPPRHHTPSSSLFFSPTAGGGSNPGTRASTYLPAGYYAAGSGSPGGGTGLAHLSGSSIPLSPLGPQAQGYSRTKSMGTTPPASPGLRPSHDDQAHPSTSSLNLTSPPQGRAPSAYLEDLFENHPPGR